MSEPGDEGSIDELVDQIVRLQLPDVSWENSVIASCAQIRLLLDLGLVKGESPMDRAAEYLLSMYHPDIDGWHVVKPYGFQAHSFFIQCRSGSGIRNRVEDQAGMVAAKPLL